MAESFNVGEPTLMTNGPSLDPWCRSLILLSACIGGAGGLLLQCTRFRAVSEFATYCTVLCMICTSTEEQSELFFIAAIIRLDTLVPDLEHFPLVQLRSGGCCGTCLRLPGKVAPRGISLRHRGWIQLMSSRAGRSGPLSPFADVFRPQRQLSYRTASRKTTAGDGDMTSPAC